MFRATNFTESNQSYRAVEGEMQIASRLWSYFQTQGGETREKRSVEAFHFACDMYQNKVGERMPDRIDAMPPERQAVWMMDAIATDWYSEWAEHAFPRVQMSHSFAAQLMATTISPKELEHITAPWPAFCIEIPDKLLPIPARGVETAVTRVCVNTHLLPSAMSEEKWWALWCQAPRIELHRAGTLLDMSTMPSKKENANLRPMVRLNPLCGRVDPVDAPLEDEDAFWEDYDNDQEDRVAHLVTRLVIGVCVMMTNQANFKERVYDLRKKLGEYRERAEKRPEGRIYTVGRPVKIDVRPAVRAFIEGRTRGPMTLQRLVAGHHKWQPHGPGSSLRKWIFIEPYWQGPSDGPIVVRPHVGVSTES